MGNQQSSVDIINDIVNKTVSNVLIQNSQNCSQSNTSVQEMAFSDIDVDAGCSLNLRDISQTSMSAPNFTCSSKSENSSELMAQLKSALASEAESKVSGLAGAINSESKTYIDNRVVNDIANNINMSSVSSCVQDNLQVQKMKFGKYNTSCPAYCRDRAAGDRCLTNLVKAGANTLDAAKACGTLYNYDKCEVDVKNVSQSLTNKAVASCMADNKIVQKAVADIANQVTNKGKASNTGIDFTMSIIASIVCSFVIVSIIIAIFLFMNSPAGQQIIEKVPTA